MKKLLLTLTMMSALTASAKTYFAKPDGKGNGSTYEEAGEFSSLVKKLNAGDILYCLGGQYNYTAPININASGTSSDFVNIWAYGDEKPIFDFRNEDYGQRGFVTQGDYIYIKGVTIRYTGKNGLLHSGSYGRFEMLDVYGNGDTGVQMKGGHSNLILNCDSHDNFDYKLGGVDMADFGGNADGFADKQYEGGGGNTYRGCRAWRNSDDGWDFYQHVTGDYGPTIIENCVCYDNGPGYYNMVGHARYETDKSWFQQFEGEGIEVTSKREGSPKYLVTLADYVNLGNANGFKLGGNYTDHNVILRNSLSAYNGVTFHLDASLGAKGIDQNNNAGTMWIYNNTSCYNAKNYGFDQTSCGTAYLYNNLTYKGVSGDVINCASYSEKNNSWNITGLTVKDADFMSVDVEGQILGPRKADGSLPDMTCMYPSATSQLIDKGTTDTGLPYYGQAPDLGCFEYDDGGTPHVPATLTVTGNTIQSVKAGRSITTVKVTAGGSATGIGRTDNTVVPGVTVAIEDMVATISGTPTTPGKYVITFVPTADFETDVTATVTLNVSDASAPTVAYITTGSGTSDADAKMLEAIREKFMVEVFDATSTSNDYSECDALVISPVPGSNAAGMAALKNYPLPTVLLKPFMMKNGVWNWGTAVNTSDLAVSVTDATHKIFQDVEINDGKVQLFTSVNTNAVTAISQLTNWQNYTKLASPTSNSSYISIADLTGATLNGSAIAYPYIMIGVSEASTANLTAAAQKLILNAMYYVLGMDIPTGVQKIDAPLAPELCEEGRRMKADGGFYNLLGQSVGSGYDGIMVNNGIKVIR